ncbi:MAG: hypothetical protein BEN19_02515 [Epulopiscium sp. Nuni2H_MBin003]|nr:MAG: hypothetical protein BEN19_02515 [Epulopiscium sp. Nuni2H_MBin003]
MKIVAIGGGTGLSTMLKGIKKYTSNITAIVNVSDNGGHSGIVRSEMNISPTGDIRNCIVGLANTEQIMKDLLQYRFSEGSLKDHNFGNILLVALTKMTGSFENAIQVTSKVLAITGKVLPVTLEDVDLYATFSDGKEVIGEVEIVKYGKENEALIKNIVLKPDNPEPTKEVLEAIRDAEIIILGPGSLYTSIISNLLVPKVADAIVKSSAKKMYVSNIMSQPGETTNFTIEDHIREIENYLGKNVIDIAIICNTKIKKKYIEKYAEEGAHVLKLNKRDEIWKRIQKVEVDIAKIDDKNSHIRHNELKLANCIFENGG